MELKCLQSPCIFLIEKIGLAAEDFFEWFAKKHKNPFRITSKGVLSTQSRSRTGTSVTSLVFETNASTNSAIWAYYAVH